MPEYRRPIAHCGVYGRIVQYTPRRGDLWKKKLVFQIHIFGSKYKIQEGLKLDRNNAWEGRIDGRDAEVQCSASPPTRGSRWMTADPVQDAALDTNTVARIATKLYSAARPRVRLHLDDRPFCRPEGHGNRNSTRLRATVTRRAFRTKPS